MAIEFALTRLRQFSPEEIPPDDRGLQVAWRMTERLEIHLTGCQLGISASSILLGVVAEPAVTRLLSPGFDLLGLTGGTAAAASVAVAVILINLVHKIWGEQAPTYLGVERPLDVARRLAPALRVWSKVMGPVIRLGDGLAKLTLRRFGVEITRSWTREEPTSREDAEPADSAGELRSRLVKVLSDAHVDRERREEVVHAFDIERIPVRDVMVPADRVTPLSLGVSYEENMDRIGRTRHVRYPLLDPEENRFVGTIYVPALFERRRELARGETSLADVASPGVRVPGDLPVSELIDRLQEEAQELALVEEGGMVVGLVTITDAFEVIAGEVEDPFD